MRPSRIFILFIIALTVLLDAYTSAEQDNDQEFTRVILTKRQNNNVQTFQEFIKRNFAYIDKKYQRLKKRQSPTSIIPLTDEISLKNDVGYYGPITIGNQNFTVTFDTGSLDLWIPDSSCTSCGNHNKFDPSKSSTFQSSTDSFTLSYGLTTNQSVNGFKAKDTVIFGGITITQQTFGLATNDPFSDLAEDGIIGLGPKNVAGFKDNGVMQNIKAQKKLSNNIIGFHLGRKKSNSNDVSFMTLGGIDQTAVTGSVEYNNANVSIGLWIILLTDAKVDGNSVDAPPTPSIVDTVGAIHSRIPGSKTISQDSQEYWVIPCNTKSVVSLSFNGGSYNIDPAELVMLPNVEGTLCLSGIQSNPEGFWLLGDVFLSSVYSVFDFDNNRVGFAQTKIMSSPNNVISNGVKISPPVFWKTF
ncbi:25910_t:CDS:2, partial [Gigaspora rosea]